MLFFESIAVDILKVNALANNLHVSKNFDQAQICGLNCVYDSIVPTSLV